MTASAEASRIRHGRKPSRKRRSTGDPTPGQWRPARQTNRKKRKPPKGGTLADSLAAMKARNGPL